MKKLIYLSTLILVFSSACTQAKISEATPTQIPTEIPATETPGPTPTQIQVEMLESLPYAEESPFQKSDLVFQNGRDGPSSKLSWSYQ